VRFALLAAASVAQLTVPSGDVLEDLRRGVPGAEARARDAAIDTSLPQDGRSQLWSMLCQIQGMRGRYADAARSCEKGSQLRNDADQDSVKFWRALDEVPPPRAVGSTIIPAGKNWAGLSEVAISVNGINMHWAVDTGAEMSIISATLAAKIGVRFLSDNLRIQSSTVPVKSRVGVIDLLQVGDAQVENVPVIVLPDTQFEMGGGNRLPPLLGLPVLVSFGRIAWLDSQARLALGELAPSVPLRATEQLYWHDDGIGLLWRAAGGSFVAHLDTGANRTSLYPDSVPMLSAAERASIHLRQTATGGAGGVLTDKQKHVATLTATIGGMKIRLSEIPVEERLGNSGARIGMDYVGQLRTLVLDFDRMAVFADRRSAR
jgi:hypothetical protein